MDTVRERECRVYFGGSYREKWTDDYRLSLEYEGRSFVTAVPGPDGFVPSGGDEELLERLRSDKCPELMRRYFQAAAEVCDAIGECLHRGLPVNRLYECCRFEGNALTAPELMRCLMDDCCFSMNDAYYVTLRSCADCRVLGVDAANVYPMQPRTAHVISILRRLQAEKLSVEHVSTLPEYRSPFGAVRCGDSVRLGFRVLGGKVERAKLILYGDDFRREYAVEQEGDIFRAEIKAPMKPAALWYTFLIETEDSAHWLCPDESGYRGRLFAGEREGFRLTVFLKEFNTPEWFRSSIMYQIFPDRFACSTDDKVRAGIEYHRALGQTPQLHESIEEPVRWQPRSFEAAYSPDDFYGGTLRGIIEKLPYLKDLGISCLYLNPIVEARSNHRYDTSDYLKVDPILGTNEDFEELSRRAAELGIRIILDGVFSHTGADSIYFNRGERYPVKGACQGKASPYYDWYEFKSFPNEYRCWWGFEDLPEVDELNKNWQNFVISGKDSVVKTWLRRGAAGWRLDVADELPDEALALIRKAAREENEDALILGEVWEDAVIKESFGGRRNYALGYSLDTVMNYPLRSAVLDFAHRRIDAYGLRDFLLSQQMNYPAPMYYSLMNLLGSHDVERLSSALASKVIIKTLPREKQLELVFTAEDYAEAKKLEKLCAAIQFSLPGVPSIYYGDEQGMRGVGYPFNRLPFREDDAELHSLYRELCHRREFSRALSTGHARFDAQSADVLLILRYIKGGRDALGKPAEDGAWLTVINRGSEAAMYSFDCSEAGFGLVSGCIVGESFEMKKLL